MASHLIDRLRLSILNPRFMTRGVLLVFLFLSLILATRWFTVLLAPRPVGALQASVSNTPRSDFKLQAARIFGLQAVSTGLTGYTLAGVYALGKGQGMAVFINGQKQISAVVGEELAPGVRLVGVEQGKVEVAVNGGKQTLQMPATAPAAGITIPGASITTPPAANPTGDSE